MNKKPKNFYQALAVMIGYIIGVGMFSLPYVVSKAGLLVFLVFLVFLAPLQYLLHLIYANIIVATDSYHRLPGYTEIYLGKGGKYFVFFAKIFGNFGALLAYIIITGTFLHQLLSPHFGGSEFFYATVLFLIEATVVYFGIKMIAKAELFMTVLLLVVVALIAYKGLNEIKISNYTMIDWKYLILPYGAMLFSMDGGGSLPIVAKLLKKNKIAIKEVVKLGTVIPIFVILAFTLTIVGISGSGTTQDALIGVRAILNDGVIFFSLIFGVLTMVTSFFGVAESIKETLWWDFKVNKNLAWAIAVFTPYAFYLYGIRNLSAVVSLVGAVGGGMIGITLMLIFRKIKKKKGNLALFDKKPGDAIVYLIISMFTLGIFYEIYYFLSH